LWCSCKEEEDEDEEEDDKEKKRKTKKIALQENEEDCSPGSFALTMSSCEVWNERFRSQKHERDS